ncbi:Cysteine dioxygenase [Podila epigama]|nr:Cysteine dioxygenase [Podila epigama]
MDSHSTSTTSSTTELATTPATKDPVPVPKSLDELVELLHKELGQSGLACEGVDVARVQALMANYKSNKADWEKYALFDTNRYTRNLVDDGNGKFNLMILAWPENVGSAIHDHSGAHCIMKVLDGELKETLYEWPEKILTEADHPDSGLGSDHSDDESRLKPCAMTIKKETILHCNETTYMSDQLGLHKIANPLTTTGSLSLHLYTPPYETCKTFNERSSVARSSGKCVFYSAKGQKLQSCPSAAHLECSLTDTRS